MARPLKKDFEKRDNRLTVYLTDKEREALNDVSKTQDRPMTQLVIHAVREWISRLSEPPESLRQAKHEKIMGQDKEMIRGFICRNGHPFWIEWVEPMSPRCCPVCGTEREIKRIWDGFVHKGI